MAEIGSEMTSHPELDLTDLRQMERRGPQFVALHPYWGEVIPNSVSHECHHSPHM